MNAEVLPIDGAADDAEEMIESTWDGDTETELQKFGDLVDDVDKKRSALNNRIAAGKSTLVERGFPADAIAAALSYHRTPESKRHNWDMAYIFTRKALGCPIQGDMFDAAMGGIVTVEHKPSKKED